MKQSMKKWWSFRAVWCFYLNWNWNWQETSNLLNFDEEIATLQGVLIYISLYLSLSLSHTHTHTHTQRTPLSLSLSRFGSVVLPILPGNQKLLFMFWETNGAFKATLNQFKEAHIRIVNIGNFKSLHILKGLLSISRCFNKLYFSEQ